MDIIDIKNLNIKFKTLEGLAYAVNDISFSVKKGEILGIVGESGSGKSVTALSIMNLLNKEDNVNLEGEIIFEDQNLLEMKEKDNIKFYGKDISMIFQEPMTSLNPLKKIYDQINEVFLIHGGKKDNYEEIKSTLKKLNIDEPDNILNKYPFELSGGLKQRVMIAIAIALKPKLIIADEPTTALDVTTQRDILNLLKNIVKEMGSSLIIITHDLGVIAELADRVIVMYRGKILESSGIVDFFDNTKHPYSEDLLKSMPYNFDGRFNTIPGSVPSVYKNIKGCVYSNRCKYKEKICLEKEPSLINLKDSQVACWKCR